MYFIAITLRNKFFGCFLIKSKQKIILMIIKFLKLLKVFNELIDLKLRVFLFWDKWNRNEKPILLA